MHTELYMDTVRLGRMPSVPVCRAGLSLAGQSARFVAAVGTLKIQSTARQLVIRIAQFCTLVDVTNDTKLSSVGIDVARPLSVDSRLPFTVRAILTPSGRR